MPSSLSSCSVLPPLTTRAEKQLESRLKVLKRDRWDDYYNDISKLDVWYRQRHHYLKYFMRKHYKEEEVSYTEAKTVLKDFFIPCNNLMLHAVCRCLDPHNQRIINFGSAKRLLRSEKPKQNIRNVRTLAVVDSFYFVHMKYLPLLSEGGLPCHFETLVRADMYIGKLSEIIQEKTGLISKRWLIFGTAHKSDLPIPEKFTFSQLKTNSGTPDRPGIMLLFYTGELEFMECPLLLTDYYSYLSASSRKLQRKKQRDSIDIGNEDDDEKTQKPSHAELVQAEREKMLLSKKEIFTSFSVVNDAVGMKRSNSFFSYL